MSYVQAIDVSQWQGAIDWNKVTANIAIIKMSGGDAGLYYDSQASANYYGAKKHGIAVGGYHFGGGKLSATTEADYFLSAMQPLDENDVMVLDCEAHLASRSDVVKWCADFMTHIHGETGVWPLIYMSLSVFNAHNWDSVTKHCGLWLAAWNDDPAATLTSHVYVMHQYTSTGRMAGISGNVDLDAWFGTVAQFQKYGYHAPKKPAPKPQPQPDKAIIEKLQLQLRESEKKVASQSATILSLHTQVNSLKDQLANADDDNADAARDLKNAQKQVEAEKKIIKNLRKTISTQKAQLAACGQEEPTDWRAALRVLLQSIVNAIKGK
jgi:GH25 family lysozyme M1 (1,4-beta-N-acetylmuramidase)